MACVSRWSEAGRACSGAFWALTEQNPAADGFNWNEFKTVCESETGCLNLVDGDFGIADTESHANHPLASTMKTGFYLQIILILGFVGMCLGCVCSCCGAHMMMKKMQKKQAEAEMK